MSNCQKEVEDFDTIYWNQDKEQFESPLLCVDIRIIIYELHLMYDILGRASSIYWINWRFQYKVATTILISNLCTK